MAVNLTTKYAAVTDEVLKNDLLSSAAVNTSLDQEWVGANSVKVYTLVTQALSDYNRTAASARFGALSEVQDTVQTLTISNDKSFNAAIDKGNELDTVTGVRDPAKFLAQQIKERVQPLVDTVRFNALAAAATPVVTVITASNAYATLAADIASVVDAEVPSEGLVVFATPTFISKLKQDSAFVKASDMAQEMLIKGAVGMVDGAVVVRVPSGRMPASTNYILAHNTSLISPVKLATYRVLQPGDSENIDGWIIQGRINFDAFVLASRVASVRHSTSA